MNKSTFFITVLLLNSSLLFSQVTNSIDSVTADCLLMPNEKSSTKGLITPLRTVTKRDSTVQQNQRQLLETGNVGIGVESPAIKLEVAGKVGAEYGTSSSASYVFDNGDENTGFSSPAIQSIAIIVGGSEKARFVSNGNLGLGTGNPHSSALLDITSTTKGVLPPRMVSTQRTAISSPAIGLLVFQTDSPAGYYYYTGTNWVSIEGVGTGAISSSLCIDFDGNAYPTFQIGTQVWMAENLRVTHYRNGDAIPNVTDGGAWAALTTGAYCWYNNSQSTNAKYGALYNWHAVDDSRGLCPVGWHEPTDAEWTTLTTYLGGLTVAGGKMKSVSALWNSPNADATNNSGFSGLPGGYRYNNGYFYDIGDVGFWWSSTEYGSEIAWSRQLSHATPNVYPMELSKLSGLSVRCLRD
jgi:uncharacterized protein (TIGR02145 family)